MTTRRELLLALGAVGAHALLPGSAQAAAARALGTAPLSGIGVQLYMLRQEMRRDPEATIGRIAALGFAEIEWWGAWERTPVQLRALLDRHGLRSPAAHIDPAELTAARLPALIERAEIMGHETLNVAWTPPAQRDVEGSKRLAALLSQAGRTAARVGIRTGYHNHESEFADLGGQNPWEILITESDPAFVTFELDSFWAYKAGQDPRAIIERHAARITHLHLKDSSGAPEHRQRDVGDGVIDWKAILETGAAHSVQHAYVEHDDPVDAWASASASLAHLRALGD
jgi:sugar phosphate isomerase/epimerase